jgi:hypothetical protein
VITTVHWRYTGTDENGISAYISSGNTRTKSRNRNFNKQII